MNLIINTDDFGLSKDINIAIKELAEIRVISSISVLVNSEYCHDIVDLKSLNHIGIGLHFNLTHGSPVMPSDEISTLVDKFGKFYSRNELESKIKNKEVDYIHIFKELVAQYERLKYLIGDNISHIDSHQDINKFKLIRITIIKFKKFSNINIGIRWYDKAYLIKYKGRFNIKYPSLLSINKFGLRRILVEIYFRISKKILVLNSFKLHDGMLCSEDNNTRTLLKMLSILENVNRSYRNYEIMCHPAISMNGLFNTNMLNSRVEEYEILKSELFIKFINKNNLISYRDL